MHDATAPQATDVRCQARPRAARPGYREDMLGASIACTTVAFEMLAAAEWDGSAQATVEKRATTAGES